MNIQPINKPGASRTGLLYNMTREKIIEKLGFEPNVQDDPSKVKDSWGFTVDGKEFGIWDYKGSQQIGHYSFYGDKETMAKIFGWLQVA